MKKPNPLKYFNDEKAKRVAKLTKAQAGLTTRVFNNKNEASNNNYMDNDDYIAPTSRAEMVLVPSNNGMYPVKTNTSPAKKVESKGPKGVYPSSNTSKSTYTNKDSNPLYTDTTRPNEYFNMTKTKAGQDSLAPYNSQMGLYGPSKRKTGGQTKKKK